MSATSGVDSGDTVPLTASERETLMPLVGQQSPEPSNTGDVESSSEFLRLIPYNVRAKRAFSALVDTPHLAEHHRHYVHATGKGMLLKDGDRDSRASDETPQELSENSEPIEPIEISTGYFRISLDSPTVLPATYAIGRGSSIKPGASENRNIDILLAPPKSDYTHHLLAAHAFLSMNPTSGAWLLKAVERSATSKGKFAPMKFDDEDVWHGDFQCLTKHNSRFEVAAMEYQVRFVIDTTEKEERYCEIRDQRLREYGFAIPDTAISGIPFETDHRVKSLATFRRGLGSGTFGGVYEGFDLKSGDLRVIKELEIRREKDMSTVENEIKANVTFGNTRGLVRMYDWQNSNGDQIVRTKNLPLKVYMVLEKGRAFSEHRWQDGAVDWQLRKKLLVDLLLGLITIHNLGWMHRDITPQNILFFPQEPQRAALFDFGKICFTDTDTITTLAGWRFLPPEIQKDKDNKYGQKIDIWMLAFALFISWYGPVAPEVSPRILSHHKDILHQLNQEKTSGLSGLLGDMLSWNARLRPSAKMALTHPCLRDVGTVIKKTSDRKRLPA